MSEEDDIRVAVDEDDYQRALVEATRAMVVQNAHFGQRFDLLKKWRSSRLQTTLANIGAIICGLAAVLAGLSVAIEWTDVGEVPWLRVSMLLLFFVLFLVFENTERLQTAGLQRINDSLNERAHAMLEGTGARLPATVEYVVDEGEIRGTWTDEEANELATWRHPITEQTYILAGATCLSGFDDNEKLTPAFFCFCDDDARGELLDALAEQGAEVEAIDQALLPEDASERPWPALP